MASIVHEGDLDFSHLTLPTGLELPEHVGGCLDLSGLTSAEGVKLPEHVGGDLSLGGLTSAEGLKLPEDVGGSLDLSGLTSAEGLKLPEHVGENLGLSGLTSAEGLKLPLHVGGDIYLWSLDEDEYDQEVHGPAELGGEVHFSDPNKEEAVEEPTDSVEVESTAAESTSEDTSGLDLLEGAMLAAVQKAVDEGTAPPEMEQALARHDRFNLTRTPNFEPRRGPNVPSYVGGARTPLLYMPIRSGPEDGVERWLSQRPGFQTRVLHCSQWPGVVTAS